MSAVFVSRILSQLAGEAGSGHRQSASDDCFSLILEYPLAGAEVNHNWLTSRVYYYVFRFQVEVNPFTFGMLMKIAQRIGYVPKQFENRSLKFSSVLFAQRIGESIRNLANILIGPQAIDDLH